MKVALFFVFASVVLHVHGGPLLMGTMIGKGRTKEEALGGMVIDELKEVKGNEIAKGVDTKIDPENKLLKGETLGQWPDGEQPSSLEVKTALARELKGWSSDQLEEKEEKLGEEKFKAEIEKALSEKGLDPESPVEKEEGTVLDNNLQSGRYVANPAMVLGDLLASGGPESMPEMKEGKIIAGDAAEVDVLSMP